MMCELCGNPLEFGKKVKLEGSIIVACDKCASSGEVVGSVRSRPKKTNPLVVEKKPKDPEIGLGGEQTLVDDYPKIIRRAREKRGFRQSDLGKKINEPESVVHRLEAGRMRPHKELAEKLMKTLGILLYSDEDSADPNPEIDHLDDLTLGDMVVIKKKKK